MMEEAFTQTIPFPVHSVRLERGNPEHSLAQRYEAGAEIIYEQVVNAA